LGIIKFLLVLLFLVGGWLVGWSNNTPVSFSFAAWTLPPVPVFVVYFAFLITGLLLGLVLGRLVGRR
jgi:uncharacterized integral membrane protein